MIGQTAAEWVREQIARNAKEANGNSKDVPSKVVSVGNRPLLREEIGVAGESRFSALRQLS